MHWINCTITTTTPFPLHNIFFVCLKSHLYDVVTLKIYTFRQIYSLFLTYFCYSFSVLDTIKWLSNTARIILDAKSSRFPSVLFYVPQILSSSNKQYINVLIQMMETIQIVESLISTRTAHSTHLFMIPTRKYFVKFKFPKNTLRI